jgi:hypothetical protein
MPTQFYHYHIHHTVYFTTIPNSCRPDIYFASSPNISLLCDYEKEKTENVKRKRSNPRKSILDAAQPKILSQFSVEKKKTLPKEEKLIADFVVKGIHPLSVVKEEGFKNVKGE